MSGLSILWFIAVGALFFWIMRRGGCGMHGAGAHHRGHAHSGGPGGDADASAGHNAHERASDHVAIDPVCGMSVHPARAAGTRRAGAVTYYFCSASCLEHFDQDPERYATRSSRSPTHGSHAGRGHGC